MFEQFDSNALEIIEEAKLYSLNHYKIDKIGTEAFLYVMFKREDSICRILLEDYRLTLDEIEEMLSRFIIIRNKDSQFTDKFEKIMETATIISKENKCSSVYEEHLLFALFVVNDTIFIDEIKKLNLDPVSLLEELKEYFSFKEDDEVNKYSINMTELAKENKLNKMIGREEYLDKMKIVLERKTKNNVLLIGSAGVGKTALVEGLCYSFLTEEKDYKIVSINVSSIVANTKYRGDFEARINRVLNEVSEMENTIIFIDEIHTIVGAGSSDNSLDIANIIKPYLARSSFRCIGATTAEEYQKTIVKDKALARRFQTIFVNEMTVDETRKILQNIKKDYENYHGVVIDDKAIDYIIKLSDDKINNRKFPDKAIDLMDEAMCICKRSEAFNVRFSHINEAIKNICGYQEGIIDYDYTYNELKEYYLDNLLEINKRHNLVSITFHKENDNVNNLIEEVKKGFGLTNEMVLKLNMSNYSESYSISSLIGTPPGYVGYEDGGILSEHFSKFSYQLIVIEQLEKASNEVVEFFKSVLNTGFFYDKKGREFKTNNTVFIFVREKENRKTIGFLQDNITIKEDIKTDVTIHGKKEVEIKNGYVDSLKYKGYDLHFDKEDFKNYESIYKECFFKLLKNYNEGKYLLKYNLKTNKVDIFKN